MDDLRDLATGTWHIVRSTLPMWRKQAGAITYAPLPDGSVADVVTARKGDRIRHIVGIDEPARDGDWQWQWRGVQPLTFLIRSRWSFVAGDADAGWALTLFEKTIATAAGIDVYCRSATADPAVVDAARRACAADPRTRDMLDDLRDVPPWPRAGQAGR